MKVEAWGGEVLVGLNCSCSDLERTSIQIYSTCSCCIIRPDNLLVDLSSVLQQLVVCLCQEEFLASSCSLVENCESPSAAQYSCHQRQFSFSVAFQLANTQDIFYFTRYNFYHQDLLSVLWATQHFTKQNIKVICPLCSGWTTFLLTLFFS